MSRSRKRPNVLGRVLCVVGKLVAISLLRAGSSKRLIHFVRTPWHLGSPFIFWDARITFIAVLCLVKTIKEFPERHMARLFDWDVFCEFVTACKKRAESNWMPFALRFFYLCKNIGHFKVGIFFFLFWNALCCIFDASVERFKLAATSKDSELRLSFFRAVMRWRTPCKRIARLFSCSTIIEFELFGRNVCVQRKRGMAVV